MKPPPIVILPTLGRQTMTESSSPRESLSAFWKLPGSLSTVSCSLASTASWVGFFRSSAACIGLTLFDLFLFFASLTSQTLPLLIPSPSSSTCSICRYMALSCIVRTQSPICVTLGTNTTNNAPFFMADATVSICMWQPGMSRMT